MPQKRPLKKNLIVDVGTGNASFVKALKERFPKDRVLGIDSGQSSGARLKMGMGAFFSRLKKPERIKQVWLNHVDVFSRDNLREFGTLAKSIPAGIPIILTAREKFVPQLKSAISFSGLELKSEKRFNRQMLGSEHTKHFFEQAENGLEKEMPIRIVAVKPKGKK